MCYLLYCLTFILIVLLLHDVKALDIGIDIDGEKINIFLYTDDILLIAESENDLQLLLDVLNACCNKKLLNVNLDKTKF